MTEHQSADDAALERARTRVKSLRDFYGHLVIYLVVNAGLVLIDLLQGDGLQWAYWVIIGWGIGLAAHAVNVFVVENRFTSRWEARKLDQFIEEERRTEEDR